MRRAVQERHAALVLQKRERRRRQRFPARQAVVGVEGAGGLGVPSQLRLLGLLQASERRGYPIKVALVAGPEDLVDDLTMLSTPQAYAEFVAAAIDGEPAAPILVVTPSGLGAGGRSSVDGRLRPLTGGRARSILRGVAGPRKANGDELGRVAMTAVRRVARAGGHPLSARVAPAKQYVPPQSARRATDAGTESAPGGPEGMRAAVPALLGALALGGVYLRSRVRRRLTLPASLPGERTPTLSNNRSKL